MKFRCDRDALSEALQTVQRGVSSRPGIPALTGVLLEATDAGQLTLTTTDLEVSARLTIDVQVTEAGTALVPARLLGDTVKSLSDAPVDLETDQSQARIRCAAYEGSLRLLPAEDFPGLQEPGGTRVQAEAGAFAEAVSQVGRAASRDEARPVLTGVLVEISREGCMLVATDSYRLAVRELVATADGEAKAIVPERALSEAGRAAAADEKGSIEIAVDDAQVSFRVGRPDDHVAPDRGRVPELPAAAARHAREPADGVAPAAARCRAPRRAARARHDARAHGVQRARREALLELARSRPGGRDGRGALRGRGPDGGVQPAVPDRRADRGGRRVDPPRRARRAEARRRARRERRVHLPRDAGPAARPLVP